MDDEDGANDDLGNAFTDQPEDELASLISFINLENVVKHIIRKFKHVESHNENSDSEIKILRADLDTRATLDMVGEVQGELSSRTESFNRTFAGQKESINTLEIQLERTRLACNALEKKLEGCIKEKAVQDRLIRELQDALQDKVAVAELNMFEAKFAGYTTKLEHQEVISQLCDYARVDMVERNAESVKMLSTQFDDYTRTAKVEQQLQELRDWVSGELQHYAKARTTLDKIDEIQGLIRDQSLSFERVHATIDDKIRGISDRVTSIYTELNSDLQTRALAEDLRDLRDAGRKYALKAETDAFQQDCVPKLRFCVDSIRAFDDRLRAQDGAIQRMDEVLLDKAAKYDIVVMNAKVDQCYQREEGRREFTHMSERLDQMNKKFEQYMNDEEERLSQYRPPDYTAVFEDINGRITLKADQADLVEMYQLKANRIDADELAKLQDIIHRQLEYLACTTHELSKLVLTEAKAGESKSMRNQKRDQVMMQSGYLWNWIQRNEPPPNLETLRPPPQKKGSASGGAAIGAAGGTGKGVGNEVQAAQQAVDKDKRRMDDHKRLEYEKKLGYTGS